MTNDRGSGCDRRRKRRGTYETRRRAIVPDYAAVPRLGDKKNIIIERTARKL